MHRRLQGHREKGVATEYGYGADSEGLRLS